MIKAVQRAVGALDNGYIGNQTMSDIAARVDADCFPLNVELYGQPAIIGRDINPYNPKGSLPMSAISGSFSWAGQPCSILVRNGQVLCSTSCHAPANPESVLYKTRDGLIRAARVTSINALPLSSIVWAVGGLGLLGLYNPTAEGFVGAYSDVLRKTNHTLLGSKGGMLYGVYCKSMTAAQVNAYARDKLKLDMAIMLDGGHVAAINGAVNKINISQRQYYAIKFV